MATELTSYERYKRMFEHREADRVPIMDDPWGSTLERWHREGMPANVSFVDFFGLDKVAGFGVDISPRYPGGVLEETDEYVIFKSNYGVTMKQWKHSASTPQFLDFTIVDRPSWAEAKARMTASPDRVDWAGLKAAYPVWMKEGYWKVASFWFGFDVTHSWTIGTERMLIAIAEDPEWCSDLFNHFLDTCLGLWEQVLDAGYQFDEIFWPDDMGYKQHTFFSLETWREILKPVQARAIEWAHSHGMYAHLHSCGYVEPFIPELVELGLDALNPLEVKAGMDPLKLKREWGNKLVLHGGMNAVLYEHMDQMEAEMRRLLPALKENGGYIFASDHSVPDSVSLEDFRRFVDLAKELGSYE